MSFKFFRADLREFLAMGLNFIRISFRIYYSAAEDTTVRDVHTLLRILREAINIHRFKSRLH